jgi:hypothetical protein
MFDLGQIVSTPGAIAAASKTGIFAGFGTFLARHRRGDWGTLDAEDKAANDAAVKNGERILSVYEINGTKFWIITEADRSVTTILLPSDY